MSGTLFKTISLVAEMGEIFNNGDQKKTNDWKKRMLLAGLGDKGLTMPDDWESLTEDEKERRLNGVIKVLKENI